MSCPRHLCSLDPCRERDGGGLPAEEGPGSARRSWSRAAPVSPTRCRLSVSPPLSPDRPAFKALPLPAPDYEVGGGRSDCGQLTRALCSIPAPRFSWWWTGVSLETPQHPRWAVRKKERAGARLRKTGGWELGLDQKRNQYLRDAVTHKDRSGKGIRTQLLWEPGLALQRQCEKQQPGCPGLRRPWWCDILEPQAHPGTTSY